MPISPATDPELVRGLQAGRRDAFARLYDEYTAPIYNLCARVLGDREEAKDVTQEVFEKVFTQLPAADADSFKLRPWLYRVATNACFNRLRSRRHLEQDGDARLDQVAAGVDEFERAQTVALVEQSLGAISERYRTALVLKDLQGLPPDEIAEVMEVSRPTADVLVHRARASFRAAFTRLAGSDAAPAALGLVLVPLSLPAALKALPPLAAQVAPVHAPVHPPVGAAAAPTGAGLLTQIGAALTTKAAITAAAAAVAIGGGVVAVKHAERNHTTTAVAAVPSIRTTARPQYSTAGGEAGHDAHWAGHGTAMGAAAHHTHHAEPAGHHSGDHSGSGSHHAGAGDAHDATATSTHHAAASSGGSGDKSESMTAGHDGTESSGSHDGGDTSGSHDGGSRPDQ
jgi:RNA polymerase sigma-70 factor, ECF subfamily